jgi:anti-sigma B factor antagonist
MDDGRLNLPWKSGALAPRKAGRKIRGFSPCRQLANQQPPLTPYLPPTTIPPQSRGASQRMSLKIESREVAHVSILDIHGRIVLGEEIHQLRDAVRELLKQDKKKIILNLANVDYIDSSGVGELVGSFTTVRNAGGELKLLNLTEKVKDILYVTKLYTVFDIKDDEFHAVKSFDYFFAK